MTYQQCEAHIQKNPYAEMDEFIMFKGNLYQWSGGGQFGKAYFSVDPQMIQGKQQRVLLKIMPYYEDNPYDHAHFDNEILVQKRAAYYNLGPAIYEYDKEQLIHSPESLLRFPPNSPYCQFHKYNYVLMEYYDVSPEGGWKQILAYQLRSHYHFICELIAKLISLAKISIPRDAASHFFYHPQYGYRMIDYGDSKPIETIDQDEHIKEIEANEIYGCSNLTKKVRDLIRPSHGPVTRSMTKKAAKAKNRNAGKPYARGGRKRHHKSKTRRIKRHIKYKNVLRRQY